MMIGFSFGHWEIIAILVIVLLLFGHRIPGMARSLGSGITEFKRGLKSGDEKPPGDKPGSEGPAGTAGKLGDSAGKPEG